MGAFADFITSPYSFLHEEFTLFTKVQVLVGIQDDLLDIVFVTCEFPWNCIWCELLCSCFKWSAFVGTSIGTIPAGNLYTCTCPSGSCWYNWYWSANCWETECDEDSTKHCSLDDDAIDGFDWNSIEWFVFLKVIGHLNHVKSEHYW